MVGLGSRLFASGLTPTISRLSKLLGPLPASSEMNSTLAAWALWIFYILPHAGTTARRCRAAKEMSTASANSDLTARLSRKKADLGHSNAFYYEPDPGFAISGIGPPKVALDLVTRLSKSRKKFNGSVMESAAAAIDAENNRTIAEGGAPLTWHLLGQREAPLNVTDGSQCRFE